MSWSVARKCSRRYSSKDIHKYLCCIFYFSLQNSSFVAYFVFGNSIKLCLHWIEHSNDKFWIRTLRKGCLGFAESQCRNPQNIQLVLCPQLQHKTYSYFMFVHISKQFWLDRNSKLARYSNNLILKTRLSFLLCAAAIVKMVYCHAIFLHFPKQCLIFKLTRYSLNLILKTRLSFLLCAAAIVKMVY